MLSQAEQLAQHLYQFCLWAHNPLRWLVEKGDGLLQLLRLVQAPVVLSYCIFELPLLAGNLR